jgi:hypothetical protein
MGGTILRGDYRHTRLPAPDRQLGAGLIELAGHYIIGHRFKIPRKARA